MKNLNLESPALSLRRTLRGRDYFTLAFGSMVGVGWMLVIDDWLMRGGSGGAMLGFLIGGLLLVPIGYAYGRLTERMPDAGSEIAYTGMVFPKWVVFATGWAMTLAYLIVCPYEAVAIGRVASYVFPQMNTFEMYRVGGYPVYLPHLVAGLLLTAIIVTVNYRGVQLSARFQNFMTFGLLAIFAVFASLGLWRGQAANLQPFFAGGAATSATSIMSDGLVSTLLVLQIVPYFMTGFEAAPKCSEEASADFSPKHFTRVLVPISEVGSLASAIGWLATCLAFCAGAAGGMTLRAKMIGVAGSAVAAMLILIKVLPWIPGSFRSYEFMALGGWIVLGAILWRRRA